VVGIWCDRKEEEYRVGAGMDEDDDGVMMMKKKKEEGSI
jgi:hypothetical protein